MGKTGRGWTLGIEPDVEGGIRAPVPPFERFSVNPIGASQEDQQYETEAPPSSVGPTLIKRWSNCVTGIRQLS